MRNKIFAMIALSAVLLTGCTTGANTQPSSPETQFSTITTDPTETTEQTEISVPQKPMLALSLPVYCEQNKEGDVIIFEHVYQSIDLIVPESEIGTRVTKDFLKRINTEDMAQQINEWAVDSYPIFADDWAHYICRVTYEPVRFDAAVLSLYGSHAYFADMHFTEGANKSVTYDMTTGKTLKLTDILTSFSRDELKKTILDSLEKQAEGIELYEDYQNVVSQRFSGSLSQDTDWYLGNDGLYFFFSPYEIAPRSSGVITVQIPYSQLAGKMDDAYFPPETELTNGSINAAEYTDNVGQQYTRIANVMLHNDEIKTVLYSELSVSDVRLELGAYDSNIFIPQHTIFATPSLTPGDAVVLHCDSKDLSTLRISYKNGDQVHYLYFDTNGNLIYNN